MRIESITTVVKQLCQKHGTRDPYELCDALGIRIRYKDLGVGIKGYYFYTSRIRNIVLNDRVSDTIRLVLLAHELGHDRLHQDFAMMKGLAEISFLYTACSTEYDANIFAAELLIDDEEVLELFNEGRPFFEVARELYVPVELLDFKLRILKSKGHPVESLHIANGDFLKNDIDGCFDEDIWDCI